MVWHPAETFPNLFKILDVEPAQGYLPFVPLLTQNLNTSLDKYLFDVW